MRCLTDAQLLRTALLGPGEPTAAHLRSCPDCAARWREWRQREASLAAAHAEFDQGHAAGRERLLAAVAMERTVPREGSRMRKRILVGAVLTALLVAAAGVMGLGPRPPSALAMTAEALRQVQSYQCRATTTEDGDRLEGLIRWAAPGSVRFDLSRNGQPDETIISPVNSRRMRIRHGVKRYDYAPPKTVTSFQFLNLIGNLANYAGRADREFSEERAGKAPKRGFEIGFAKLDPNGRGILRIWIDPDTKLPIKLEHDMPNSPPSIMTDFCWNVPTDGWFDLTPPAGYMEDFPPTAEQRTETIRTAMQIWLQHYPGRYPASIKPGHGDTPADNSALHELAKAAGVPMPWGKPDFKSQPYRDICTAAKGFGQIQLLQTQDVDAAYHGERVKPTDKDKVLFRWRLESGEYRVIYGDLRGETVPAARLAELERR